MRSIALMLAMLLLAFTPRLAISSTPQTETPSTEAVTLTPERHRDVTAALEACMRIVGKKRACPEVPVYVPPVVEPQLPWWGWTLVGVAVGAMAGMVAGASVAR